MAAAVSSDCALLTHRVLRASWSVAGRGPGSVVGNWSRLQRASDAIETAHGVTRELHERERHTERRAVERRDQEKFFRRVDRGQFTSGPAVCDQHGTMRTLRTALSNSMFEISRYTTAWSDCSNDAYSYDHDIDRPIAIEAIAQHCKRMELNNFSWVLYDSGISDVLTMLRKSLATRQSRWSVDCAALQVSSSICRSIVLTCACSCMAVRCSCCCVRCRCCGKWC